MARAIELAREAAVEGEIPVGAVIVKNGEIIAEGRNRREQKQSAVSHAEIEAIRNANRTLGSWRLDGCSIYVTLEPCPMCAGAIISSRLDELVFGAFDLNMGCADSVTNLFSLPLGVKKIGVYGGIKEDECRELLTEFFKEVRER